MLKRVLKVLARVLAIVPIFLGGSWIYTFGFTSYRHHLAFIGLPLGILTLALGLGMLFLNRNIIELTLFLIYLIVFVVVFLLLVF